MADKLSGCNCCGCDLWSFDFRFALVPTRPTIAEVNHRYKYSLLGIDRDKTGQGLLYHVNGSMVLEQMGQWFYPRFDVHPEASDIWPLLIGGSYFYYIDNGRYRIADGAEPVVWDAPFALTASFKPWQNMATHGGENDGVFLKTDEAIVTKELPVTPWYARLENALFNANGVADYEPIWIGDVGSGMSIEVIDASDATVIATIAIEKLRSDLPPVSGDYFDDRWDDYEPLRQVLSGVGVTIESAAGDSKRFWLCGAGSQAAVDETGPTGYTDISRLPIADYSPDEQERPEILLSYSDGMLSFWHRESIPGDNPNPILFGLIGRDDTDVALPVLSIPGSQTRQAMTAIHVGQLPKTKLRFKAVGSATLVSGLKASAYRMQNRPTALGEIGHYFSDPKNADCELWVPCLASMPGYSPEFTVNSFTMGDLALEDDADISVRSCASSHSRPFYAFETTETEAAAQDEAFILMPFTRVETRVKSPTGFYTNSSPSYNFDATDTVTLPTYSRMLSLPYPFPSHTIDLSIASDPFDGEFVYVTATLTLATYTFGINDSSGIAPTPIAAKDCASVSTSFSDQSLPTVTVTQSKTVTQNNLGFGFFYQKFTDQLTYRKRVPRWNGKNIPTLAFGPDDILSAGSGTALSRTRIKQIAIAMFEGPDYSPAAGNVFKTITGSADAYSTETYSIYDAEFEIGPPV